jgi:predicted nucleotidyltransferase
MFGLKEKDITDIRAVLQSFPEVEKALIFGSRARGNHRHGSDVDMALMGAEFHTATKICRYPERGDIDALPFRCAKLSRFEKQRLEGPY